MSVKVAITGGIGSGKSTVLSLLREAGYPVFSCDKVYREIMSETSYIMEIEKHFPFAVKSGCIDRKALGSAVFNNSKQREKLDAISHPLIMQRIFERMNTQAEMLVFAEVPLLYEGKLQSKFDAVIVVLRDVSLRIQAVKERDGLTDAEARERILAQFDYEDRSALDKVKTEKTFYLTNDSSLNDLKHNLKKIIARLNQIP